MAGIRDWVLLEGDRRLVTTGFLTILAIAFLVTVQVLPTPLFELMQTGDPVSTMFQALTTSLITVVSLVVVLNQLVLSQEIQPVADQRDRMEGSLQFRRDVESTVESAVAPADPADLMGVLCERIRELTETYREWARAGDNESRHDVSEFMTDTRAAIESVRSELETADFGTYDVISATLDFDYSRTIREIRVIEANHGDHFSDEIVETHQSLIDALELYGLGREHFKTLYFEWELVSLSRSMLYLSMPALVVSISLVLFFSSTVTSVSVAGIHGTELIVIGGVLVVLAPVMHLFSYILRIATMAKRTLAIGPFVLVSEQ